MNTEEQEYRFEVKIPIPLNRLQRVQTWLINNAMSFRKHHDERDVNSLYLDTPLLARYEENLSGISNRKKVRIRWYGDLTDAINAKLEFKHRRGSKGYKILYDTSLSLLDPNFSWAQQLLKSHQRLPMDGQILWGAEHTPIIICRYTRKYYISRCNKIRATIDYNMTAYDQRYHHRVNLIRPVSLGDYVLLELKTDACNEQALSQLISTCPLRPSRHSKYVNSIRNLTWL
ncbi:polyphosphate polymerase domain-containing protein [Vibrio lamellibrachiae]|uniref:polyphosphate polymerase domain-containing protein n=1 Tax=Vibrio lamellibrachiae TaxID=2910253 RepID=UPI003D120839